MTWTRRWLRRWLVGLAGVAVVAVAVTTAVGEDPPMAPRRDVGKRDIELPTEKLIADKSAGSPETPPPAKGVGKAGGPADREKAEIERPTKAVVAEKSAAAADSFTNPKVQPGKLAWHATYADACAASAKSGKPVLLFQMMGKLDDQFC